MTKMTKITDRIWLGDSNDARTEATLRGAGITHVLNCDKHQIRGEQFQDIFRYHCGFEDGHNGRLIYEAALNVFQHIMEENASNRIMVHCWAGQSRSPFIISCYLVRIGLFSSVKKAEEYLGSLKPDVCINPGHYSSYDPLNPEWSSPVIATLKLI